MSAGNIILVVFIGLAITAIGLTLFGLTRAKNDSEEKVRSITGVLAVLISVGAISISAIVGIRSSGAGVNDYVPLLTSGFTAVTAVTTAYFGIKAVTNTAETAIKEKQDGIGGDGKGGEQKRFAPRTASPRQREQLAREEWGDDRYYIDRERPRPPRATIWTWLKHLWRRYRR